uniref:uncharacterized protein LOC122588909 n=1 Tax=Erigeron canadensis TaxID=72917 RepID=UPI001CB90D94|nr:uncharacterized protein LOC122588909 [Erigeron canadensis]
MQSTSRAEAERLLGIAEKLLQGKDLNGCRDFALLAQETEPLLDGSDQILAVVDVLLASDKRVNNKPDWYAILQLDSRRNDDELIKKQYRKLALLLHPDKNKYPYADSAFRLVADAWAVLSDSVRKSGYDNELFAFTKVDLVASNKDKMPVRRNPGEVGPGAGVRRNSGEVGVGAGERRNQEGNIWTTCPYCYNLYEYPKMYLGCCLRCVGCKRAFEAVAIPPESLPPFITGKEAYYCCWGYFPMGFAMENSETAKTLTIPNWMPPMFPTDAKAWPSADSLPDGSSVPLAKPGEGFVPPMQPTPPVAQPVFRPNVQQRSAPPTVQPTVHKVTPSPPTAGATVPRKRGRPRKNPL